LTEDNMTVILHPPYSSPFPNWSKYEINATDVTEAESQVVMNNLAEHYFQDAFKMSEALRTVHTRGSGLLWGWWWLVGPKLFFDQIAAPVPEIMDGSL
jgi:hypothetical protein